MTENESSHRGVRPQFRERGLRAVGPSAGLFGTPAAATGSANRALSRILSRALPPDKTS